MSLRYTILALLSAEPMSGYDVDQVLDEMYGYMWTAPHSQIYPMLRRMEEDGVISAEVQLHGDRSRRVYSLLEAGADEIQRTTAEPNAYSPSRDAARVRASMLHLLDLDQCEAFFRAHVAHHLVRLQVYQNRVAAVRSGESSLLRARLAHAPAREHDKISAFKLHAYQGLAMSAQTEIEWAQRGLAMVDSFKQSASADAAEQTTETQA